MTVLCSIWQLNNGFNFCAYCLLRSSTPKEVRPWIHVCLHFVLMYIYAIFPLLKLPFCALLVLWRSHPTTVWPRIQQGCQDSLVCLFVCTSAPLEVFEVASVAMLHFTVLHLLYITAVWFCVQHVFCFFFTATAALLCLLCHALSAWSY